MADKFAGKRVVILGLARQGTALARYLARAGARVVVSDLRQAGALSEALDALADLTIEYALGGHPESLLDGADLLCLSGGVPRDLPIVQVALECGIPLSNDAQIFLDACPTPVIGITGSAGKTTTTTLVGRMLGQTGAPGRVWVGGNIGNPLISELDMMGPGDRVAMELSSFQLEIMTTSPAVGAVLNVTPNHLDRHGTMAAYAAAKARILDFQGPGDTAVLGRDDPGAAGLRDRVKGRLVWFSAAAGLAHPEHSRRAALLACEGAFLRDDRIKVRFAGREREVCRVDQITLRGRHNRLNVLAACAIAGSAGVEPEAMRDGIAGFTGVAHRLEFVREVNGARWYNDSIATAPERACAAIRSFDEPLVLLAGGRDKNLPWEAFGALVRERVTHLVLFGEARELIASAVGPLAIGPAGASAGLQSVSLNENLAGAVLRAATLAQPGDVVLLAPGGTSFDEFTDFAERGERFRELVEAL